MVLTSSPLELARILRTMGAKRIVIDGINGAGKSHLAQTLAAELDFPIADLDDYLAPGQESFVPSLRIEQLERDLLVMPSFVLAGICMIEVLEILGLKADALVYIKRMLDNGWQDKSALVTQKPEDDHIAARRAEHNEIVNMIKEDRSFKIDEEVIRYHIRYLPHQHATICYERSVA